MKTPPRHAVRASLAAVSVATLAACGTASAGTDTEAATEIGESEGTVSILTWPGYVEDGSNDPDVDWVSDFEETTQCTVTSKTYGTSDEAYQLMQNGGYDVVAASGDLTLRLIAADLVSPVNTDLLENYDGIYDFLKDKEWNSVDGVSYGVPHGYGANLLMYNTEVVDPAPTSWSAVFDDAADYAGQVTSYDSPIYIADAALYLMSAEPDLGITNPYALDQEQFDAAVELLKVQRESVGEYWSDYLKEIQAFESGDSVIGTSWQVIQNYISTGNTAVVLPEEGATGWSDTWMVTSDAESPNCAYMWLDYISSPEVNGVATEYFGEAPSSEAACDFRADCEAFHAGDEEYAAQIWYWTTPVAECVDGRTDVECVDYSEWTKAWQEIKG